MNPTVENIPLEARIPEQSPKYGKVQLLGCGPICSPNLRQQELAF